MIEPISIACSTTARASAASTSSSAVSSSVSCRMTSKTWSIGRSVTNASFTTQPMLLST